MNKPSKIQKIRDLLFKLPKFVKLLWGLLKDARVPVHLKVLVAAALSYFVAPFDINPDFVPIAGYFDDLTIMFFIMERFFALCPREIVDQHMQKIQLKQSDFDQDMELLKETLGDKFTMIKNNLGEILKKYQK